LLSSEVGRDLLRGTLKHKLPAVETTAGSEYSAAPGRSAGRVMKF
jgi:hypothetical protein